MGDNGFAQYKGEIKELLSKALSRQYNKEIEVKEFHTNEIKQFDTPTHALIRKIDGIQYNINGEAPDLPPYIVVKKYLDSTELASSEMPHSCEEDYNIERKMLGIMDRLSAEVDGRSIKIYPRSYSWNVPECNNGRYIFRQFIPEEIITDIAKNKFPRLKKELAKETLDWNDVRKEIDGPLYCMALQHAQTQTILGETKLPKRDVTRFIKDMEVYLWKLSGKRLSRQKIYDTIKEPLEVLTKNFFIAKNGEAAVINGDLDIYPDHVTQARLLDAGGCEVGPFERDLVMYSDPAFKLVKNIETETLESYKAIIRDVHKALRSENIEFDSAKKIPRIFALSWRGNIRNAAATKTYKENYFKKTGQTDSEEFFKKEVASHLSQGIYYLHKLEDSDADDKSKKAASEIFTKIKQLNIFQDYQELMTEH